MLSRRNIRIKVMQVLYALNQDGDLNFRNALIQYREHIQHSYALFIFNLWYLVQICAYAQQDADRKNQKLRPTEEDKHFNPKLFTNELLQSLYHHEKLGRAVARFQIDSKIDQDIVRKIYTDFAQTEGYKEYVKKKDTSAEDHLQILLDLYKFCINHELYADPLEDHYQNWVDDKSLIVGSMKKTLKALPATANFLDAYIPQEEATTEFGEALLMQVYQKNQEMLELIEPTLKNWDAERVAIIDMILLKMALCELLNFPTIPTKVTLNEFVEISKLYSTDKSKDFINGILDRLLKKLKDEGRIHKEGRGLME